MQLTGRFCHLTVKADQVYPQDCIKELIIWKIHLLVVAATSVKFKSVFLHDNEQWLFRNSSYVFGQNG